MGDVTNALKELGRTLKQMFLKLWEGLKKLCRIIREKVLNFVRNIKEFFNDPQRLKALRESADRIAVVLREKVNEAKDAGYRVISCIYNTVANAVEEFAENSVGYEAESLDAQTMREFGNNDMLVLTQ